MGSRNTTRIIKYERYTEANSIVFLLLLLGPRDRQVSLISLFRNLITDFRFNYALKLYIIITTRSILSAVIVFFFGACFRLELCSSNKGHFIGSDDDASRRVSMYKPL